MGQAATVAEPVEVTDVRPERVLVVLIPLVALAAAVLAAILPLLAQFLREEQHVAIFVGLLASAVATSALRVRQPGYFGVMTFESVVVISAAVLYGVAVATIVAAAA